MIDRTIQIPGPAEVDRLTAAARRERSRIIGDWIAALFRGAPDRRRAPKPRWTPARSEMLPPALRLG